MDHTNRIQTSVNEYLETITDKQFPQKGAPFVIETDKRKGRDAQTSIDVYVVKLYVKDRMFAWISTHFMNHNCEHN